MDNDVSNHVIEQAKMYNCIPLHTDSITDIEQDVCTHKSTCIQKPLHKSVRMCLCTIALT